MGNAARSGTFRRSLRRLFSFQRRFYFAARNSENTAGKRIESGFCSYDLVSAGCRTVGQWCALVRIEGIPVVCLSQSQAQQNVRSLLAGVPRELRERRWLVMLQCFVDDSGNQPKPELADGGLFVLAGYVMDEKRWEDFSERWFQQLKRDFPIAYCRMFDAENGTGPFTGMDEVFRKRKVKDLALVVQECNPVPMACQMTWKDYNEIVVGNVPAGFDNPYAVLFYQMMKSVSDFQVKANELRNFGFQPVDFIFDEQGSAGAQCLKWYQPLKDKIPEPYKTMMSNTPQFKDDRQVMPLQAADMLAWHLRRESQFPDEDRSTAALLNPDGMLVRVIGRNSLEQLVELSKRIDPASI